MFIFIASVYENNSEEWCATHAHHDDLYGDRNRQLRSVSDIEFLYDEHNHHDHQGDHYVTHVAGGYLAKYDLQGLKKIRKTNKKNQLSRFFQCECHSELICTYIYEGEGTTDAWDLQSKHKLELGHQDVNGSCCGEARH